jgi:surface carbohydrate biosynthesis protein (TIGR04326 family)
MYTCYSVSEKEREIMPLPDIIAVNGKRAKEVLEQSGFTGRRIEIVGALRYADLKKKPFSWKMKDERTILVALSAGINDSLELVHKALRTFTGTGGITIIIKSHPTVPFARICSYIGPPPENVRFSDEPIEKLLEDADVLLYSESAVCIEALAGGVPVVHVRSDFRIDMNILEGIGGVPSVSLPEEIRSSVEHVTSPEGYDQFRAIQGIVDEFFAPVRDNFAGILIGDEAPRSGVGF